MPGTVLFCSFAWGWEGGGESHTVSPGIGGGGGMDRIYWGESKEKFHPHARNSPALLNSLLVCLSQSLPTWTLLTQSTDSNKNSTKSNIIVGVIGDSLMVNFMCQL